MELLVICTNREPSLTQKVGWKSTNLGYNGEITGGPRLVRIHLVQVTGIVRF